MAKSKSKSLTTNKPDKVTNENDTKGFSSFSVFIVLVSVLILVFSLFINKLQNTVDTVENKYVKDQKIYWGHTNRVEDDYVLHDIFTVLNRLGYKRGTNNSDWDLLWTHEWPFEVLQKEMQQLKPHQKVNHIPGTGYINYKVTLATSGKEYIPPAFRLPEDRDKLLEYSKKHPNASFVSKDNGHRHIKIVKINEIDFNETGYFIQRFIENPLLVDGHKFDIGLYTIITSIDPLRIYVYNGDIMLRFCPEKYHPFDPTNLEKYVIGDDYFPVWEVPGLDLYYNKLGYSKKETLNAYLQAHGVDTKKIYQQAEDAIRKYIVSTEHKIIESLIRYLSKRNFFELMRFDFVIDEDINVHMLESNMSPNLCSSKHPVNALLYHQILYNVFGLVGIADSLNRTSLAPRTKSEEDMLATEKNLVTYPNTCISSECQSSCELLVCQLCKHCLTDETKEFLREAFKEHNRKGDCKRIFPPAMIQDPVNAPDLNNLTPNNQLQYKWFQGKCNMDSSWC